MTMMIMMVMMVVMVMTTGMIPKTIKDAGYQKAQRRPQLASTLYTTGRDEIPTTISNI